MANKGVTLKVTVTETVPDWFQDPTFQVGGTRFPATGDGPNGSGPDNFVAGSVVEIVIIGSRVGTGTNSFTRVLSHELTHIIRDANGSFLRESQVISRDDETYNNLYRRFSETDYMESIDVVGTYTGPPGASGGDWIYQGTAGNNLIEDKNQANDKVFTGAGSDIVLSGDQSDNVTVNGSGVKMIFDSGVGYDMLTVKTIYNMSDVRASWIGPDLYVTSRLSAYSPAEDPNAIILLDYNYYHIEFISTASGEFADLYQLAYGGSGAGFSQAMSSGDFFVIDQQERGFNALDWESSHHPLSGGVHWTLDSSSPRYADILTYETRSFDPRQYFKPLPAAFFSNSNAENEAFFEALRGLSALDVTPDPEAFLVEDDVRAEFGALGLPPGWSADLTLITFPVVVA